MENYVILTNNVIDFDQGMDNGDDVGNLSDLDDLDESTE